MGKLTVYGLDASPPVRAVLLTLNALNLPYAYVQVNLFGREQLSPAYLAKNPQHTVPTLEDDGHHIWDSHAICAYLVSKYAKNDMLYPKEPLQRAIVDQRLHFESGVVFHGALRIISVPLLFFRRTEIAQERIDAIVEVYNFIETFLKDYDYIAGDHLTIADFSLISTITSLVAFVEIDEARYAKLKAWIARLQQLPYYEEANGKGANLLVQVLKSANYTVVPSRL